MNTTTQTPAHPDLLEDPARFERELRSRWTARLRHRTRMAAAGLGMVGILMTSACAATASETTASTTTAQSASAQDTSGQSSTESAAASETSDSDGSAAEVLELAQAFADTLDDEQREALYQDYTYENATNWSNFPQALLEGGMGAGGEGAPPSGAAGEAPGDEASADDAAQAEGAPPAEGEMPADDAESDAAASAGEGSEDEQTAAAPDSGTSSGRVGLQISTLSEEQRAALEALLEAALGDGENEGYDEVMSVLAADDYLLQETGGSDYGSDNYYIAFLGDPSEDGTWELQFGGHHLAVSNTYSDGELASATPSFRGTEPTGEFTYDGETYDPMTQETTALTAMLDSLSEDELAAAEIEQNDLLLGPGADGEFPEEAEGVKVSDLTEDQQQLVLAAIETYVDDLPEDEAAAYMERYEAELEDTYVSFSGGTDLSEAGDYVRIDGPSVWIELSMQNGVAFSEPHIHSVWRDRETDYAGLTESTDGEEASGTAGGTAAPA
ncbi:DUF3500 domain-containing protein [Rothia halotolerans]|uniref:DUF3500 domain-containing protein n=1 Tax=Rothia halotolerans TaxID=405770 RepID=UPI001EE042D1|nr:DUF3500 domain-containing protein [Rothia halotolerans]